MKGSQRDIIDPLESIVKNTYLFTQLAEKNKVGRQLAELAEKHEGMGWLIEKVGGNRSAKENVLTIYRNGLRNSINCSRTSTGPCWRWIRKA
ncbi:hypothetical protein [Desulforamulus ruminis]|uniref:hypothetical protein n=1 Tax=Desulforamulus ruminis TaxID=1564 RepID=UPI0002F2E7EB|nr:hypothetical protein [Desulforamulus ruminis]